MTGKEFKTNLLKLINEYNEINETLITELDIDYITESLHSGDVEIEAEAYFHTHIMNQCLEFIRE